ncbi:hypothetical protein N9K77_01980 [bacterium]|nr:hypothetical protein [bacterium]
MLLSSTNDVAGWGSPGNVSPTFKSLIVKLNIATLSQLTSKKELSACNYLN